MIIVRLIGAFATVLMAGCGAVAILQKGRRSCSGPEFISLGALFGFGVISLLLWGVGFLLVGGFLQLFVATCAIALGIAGYRAMSGSALKLIWSKPADKAEWILFSLLAIEVGVVALSSLGLPLGWDGSFNWEIKARIAFLNNGTMPQSYYRNPSQGLSHPEYPLFLPFTELWVDLWVGVVHQFWEKTIFPIWLTAGAVLIGAFVRRLTGSRWPVLLVVSISFFGPYAMCNAGITSGYADFPLGILYFISIACVLLNRLTDDPTYFRIYAAVIPLLPWMKREGSILWLAAAAAGILSLRLRLTNIRLWVVALPGILLLLGWSAYLRHVGASPPHDFLAVSPAVLGAHFSRIWPIAQAFATELLRLNHWGLFWVLVFAASLQLILQGRKTAAVLAFSLVLPMAAYAATYLFSTWPDYVGHMRRSLPRLLLELTPLGALQIGLAITAHFFVARSSSGRPTNEQSRLFVSDNQVNGAAGRGDEKAVEVFA